MIDEKKLIEKLEDYKNNDWNKQLYTSLPTVVDDCIDFVEDQPKIGEWIPCSERLPEENEEVICCLKSGIVKALVLFNSKLHGKVYAYEISDILAWQPLPAPYEVKTDE